MLIKLTKAIIVLSATAAFMPSEQFGSMPGLSADAPRKFALHGAVAMDTLERSAKSACDASKDLCDTWSRAAQDAHANVQAGVTGSIAHSSTRAAAQAATTLVTGDPIARQIALEAARSMMGAN